MAEILALGAMAAGTAVSAIGSIQKGDEQKAADQYNQQVEQQNAQIATGEADSQARIDKQNTERQIGAITAAYGAGGVDPNQGTPLDVLFDQAATEKLNQNLDIYKGQVAAASDIDQGQLSGYEGEVAQQAGITGAIGTTLSGIGQATLLSRLPWNSTGNTGPYNYTPVEPQWGF